MGALPIVDVETAKSARGLRLVVLGDVPSPWSQAAKTLVELKQIPAVLVKKKYGDTTVQAWTGIANGPIALYDDELPKTGWAEILQLLERIQTQRSLIPKEPEQRMALFGMGHELLGEGGLMWSARMFTLEASFESGGKRGWLLPVAKHLGPRYGYTPGCGVAAKARAEEILNLVHQRLMRAKARGHEYLLGNTVSALDIYLASVLNAVAPLSNEQCPMHPAVRPSFEFIQAELQGALTTELLAHRNHIVQKYFELPLLT